MLSSSQDDSTSLSIKSSRLIGAEVLDLFFSASRLDRAALRRIYDFCAYIDLLRTYSTTFARKRLIAYVYDLCARGDLCVRCTSVRVKRLTVFV